MFRKMVKFILWLILLSPILLIAYCKYKTVPPKDSWYLENFNIHDDEFSVLVNELCQSDAAITVGAGIEYNSELKLSKQSFNRVQESLSIIGSDLVQKIEGCHIKLSIWSFGFAGEGDYKDYTRAPMIHDRVEVDSLDKLYENYGPITKPSFYMRPIESGWYITYDVWP